MLGQLASKCLGMRRQRMAFIATDPSRRHLCVNFETNDGLTAYVSATARMLSPWSVSATTRRCKSSEYALGMVHLHAHSRFFLASWESLKIPTKRELL
jgi:hypothetical protein